MTAVEQMTEQFERFQREEFISRATALQSGTPSWALTAGRGAAVAVRVSPAAMPMRRRP